MEGGGNGGRCMKIGEEGEHQVRGRLERATENEREMPASSGIFS